MTAIISQTGKVWNDINGDGLQQSDEPGFANVTVTLLDANGNTVRTTTSDDGGNYFFGQLDAATYQLKFHIENADLAAKYLYTAQDVGGNTFSNDKIDSDVDTTTGLTPQFELQENIFNTTFDVGFKRDPRLVDVGDFVWFDTEADGIYDSSKELGAPQIDVYLLIDSNGNEFHTRTDDDGYYQFSEIWAGDYQIRFVAPDTHRFTQQTVGNDRSIDSNPDANGLTDTFTLTSGEGANLTIDAGLEEIPLIDVGDRVWYDSNADGLYDASKEQGAAKVDVYLIDSDGNERHTQTDDDGLYQFKDVRAGEYHIRFVAPDSYMFTHQTVGSNPDLDSNPDSNGLTDTFTLAEGDDTNFTIDAGLVKKASIGDYLWFDVNGDGQQNNEPAAPGIKVTLLQQGTPVGDPIISQSDGSYLFDGLFPGKYQVQFDIPAELMLSPQFAGNRSNLDSDPDRTTGLTDTITLDIGEQNTSIDAGYFKRSDLVDLGDKVWLDINRDGSQFDDNGQREPGVPGVNVYLLDDTGNRITGMNTTTNAQGEYGFGELWPGDYQVEFDTDSFTQKQATGVSAANNSDANSNGRTDLIELKAGQDRLDIDAGIVGASIGDYVWYDADGDGKQDTNESGADGVTVTLLKDGNPLGQPQTTKDGGQYLFTNLDAGNYQVQFDLPTGYLFSPTGQGNARIDSDADRNTGLSPAFTLADDEQRNDIDAGLFDADDLVSLGDKVWLDQNKDGSQLDDAGNREPGIPGIEVTLLMANNTELTSTFTDKNGEYGFDELWPGDYKVEFKTSGFTSKHANGVSADLNSDANNNGKTDTITLNAGDKRLDIDAGIATTVTIGDFAWIDADNNGSYNALTEQPLANVRVQLYDSQGNHLSSYDTQTDAQGEYAIKNVPLGNYQLKFLPPEGTAYGITKQHEGNYQLDSDANPTTGLTDIFEVTQSTIKMNGESMPLDSLDVGMNQMASIGDRVFIDSNDDGTQLDANGAAEQGLADVPVTLYLRNAQYQWEEHRQTSTDDNGDYLFGGLEAGTYKVHFGKLDGYIYAHANQGNDDSLDSDVVFDFNGNTEGATDLIELSSGEQNLDIDAGMVASAKISGLVWKDADRDGLRQDDETTRYTSTIGPRSNYSLYLNDQSGNVAMFDALDDNGEYSFEVRPGSYESVSANTFNYWGWGNFYLTAPNVQDNQFDEIDSDIILVSGSASNGTGKMDINPETPDIEPLVLEAGDHIEHLDIGAFTTPLALDLNRDGIQTISANEAKFDLFANNMAIDSGWLSPDDAFLAIDNNQNGTIDDITELFGGLNKGAGFAKLAEFDSNGDGVVDSLDEAFASLLIWQDGNSNKVTEDGELMTLTEAGVTSLSVDYVEQPELDNNGNLHLERSSATLSDGTEVDMTDVYFAVSHADAEAAGVDLPTLGDLLATEDTLAELLGPASEVQPLTTIINDGTTTEPITTLQNDVDYLI